MYFSTPFCLILTTICTGMQPVNAHTASRRCTWHILYLVGHYLCNLVQHTFHIWSSAGMALLLLFSPCTNVVTPLTGVDLPVLQANLYCGRRCSRSIHHQNLGCLVRLPRQKCLENFLMTCLICFVFADNYPNSIPASIYLSTLFKSEKGPAAVSVQIDLDRNRPGQKLAWTEIDLGRNWPGQNFRIEIEMEPLTGFGIFNETDRQTDR